MSALTLRQSLRISSSLSRRAFSCSARRLSTAETVELTSPATYISRSNDIYFNLSFEDWLLRHTPRSQPILFLYANTPCVVIGRNQNPWKETTPRYLREAGIPLVRRRSGGGTVYHDLGNTNFSIVLPRLAFTRDAGAKLVARAVRERLGVEPCTTNARHDVVVKVPEELKVSGSAYKIIQHRAYHHGTMLISSDLSTLGSALRSSSPNMVSKGVESMRVPVSTINSYRAPSFPPIDHSAFVHAVSKEFSTVYGSGPITEIDEVTVLGGEGIVDAKGRRMIEDGMEELQGWEWKFGQTPQFTNTITGELSCGEVTASVESKHGVITSLTLELKERGETGEVDVQDDLDRIAQCAKGLRYETLDGIGTFLGDSVRPDLSWEVVAWLQTHM